MLDDIRADVRAALDNDPAATSTLQVVLLYQGVHALVSHRVAHRLHERGHTFLARALSQFSRFLTGIEIHPGAEIGTGVFIDHGMGTVVGETAEVGDDVLLFHGVTLGGVANTRGKRHPTVGDGVLLGAHSTVLGAIEIGDGAKVGAGAVVVDPVAASETVVGVPAQPIDRHDEEDATDDDCEELAAFERRVGYMEPSATADADGERVSVGTES